jgi:hypothetical protein
MIKLKVYNRESNGEIESIGTVAQVIGENGKISLIKKNLLNKKKNIAILLTNKKGESTVLPTSTTLSGLIRNKEIEMSDVKFYPVYEITEQVLNEETGVEEEQVRHIIGMPQNDDAGTVDVTTISKADVKADVAEFSAEFELEDYVSL